MRLINAEEIKHLELEILKSFSEYCKLKNLTYFLCGGTLLGAIRHNGFIPWDDDIDVFMPRPDYEKFIQLSTDNPIKENLITAFYDKTRIKINYPFVKILNTDTIVYEKTKSKKEKINIWLDIFPIDGISEDIEYNKKLYKYNYFRKDLLAIASADLKQSKSIAKKILKIFLIPILHTYGLKRICRQIDERSKRIDYNKSNLVGVSVWGYGLKEIMKKEELKVKTHVFENSDYNIPENYDAYLSSLYGDYMTLPPEEKRIIHGFTAYSLKD